MESFVCSVIVFFFAHCFRHKYDVMSETSSVEASSLRPAEKLEWNISPDIANSIETAKVNIDRCDVWPLGSDFHTLCPTSCFIPSLSLSLYFYFFVADLFRTQI